MTTPPVPPGQNIGPTYGGLGWFLAVSAVGLAALGIWRSFNAWVLFGLVVVFVMAVLALIRFPAFDAIVRNVSSWLPFTKYKEPKP